MNTSFKVIGLARLGIKPESTAPEADALTTRPSELATHSGTIVGLYIMHAAPKSEQVASDAFSIIKNKSHFLGRF